MQQLFQNIFRQEPGNKDFLENVRAEFPFFGPAHFYALKNMDAGDAGYEQQAAKTALFFNDLFFLNDQLKDHVGFTEDVTPSFEREVPHAEVARPETVQMKAMAPAAEETVAVAEEIYTASPREPRQPEHASFENMPLFEPLHATDYFASQGIKLSEEVKAGDKLGMQLKSFTSWLKTMKKVHPENLIGSAAGDMAVQNLAEKSNLDADVVTEAMAEAYAQQGKRSKATEIYFKLSLINPSKSAIFAAKIESLKQ